MLSERDAKRDYGIGSRKNASYLRRYHDGTSTLNLHSLCEQEDTVVHRSFTPRPEYLRM